MNRHHRAALYRLLERAVEERELREDVQTLRPLLDQRRRAVRTILPRHDQTQIPV